MSAVNGAQGVAAFLLARGPHWWYGWGWQGCSDAAPHPYDPLWSIDPGAPRGRCAETAAGLFRRDFAHGRATLDCNSWSATLDFGSAPTRGHGRRR